jgi:uncharacterized lipoprotein NlpE involved in copper resistance
MKSKIIIIVFLAFIFGLTSCGNRSANNQTNDIPAGFHRHDDGTIHADGAHEHPAPTQESFTVEADSVTTNAGAAHHGHSH